MPTICEQQKTGPWRYSSADVYVRWTRPRLPSACQNFTGSLGSSLSPSARSHGHRSSSSKQDDYQWGYRALRSGNSRLFGSDSMRGPVPKTHTQRHKGMKVRPCLFGFINIICVELGCMTQPQSNGAYKRQNQRARFILTTRWSRIPEISSLKSHTSTLKSSSLRCFHLV